ncbi:hydroxypyruvate isomerase [Clavibacter michiganensis]|uniref:TIM barrel protein n=1 Tax=Clavibacter michiganensis TaxID=28447 RepID=UPI000CE8C034|nr:TIM barrel protein [Clavibacter michiganensis]PPF48852.1 hydroxypyruvate isomerase [Clavibacter michiganensis]
MLFVDLPFRERVERLHELGMQVEIWDWSRRDLPDLARTGAVFSSMTGYLRGDLITEDGADELVATARLSLDAADVLDSPRLNLHGTGLDPDGLPVRPRADVSAAERAHAVRTLARLARLGEERGRVFTLENLNTAVDHPGTPFATAAETVRLVREVDSPSLRLNLDLYHAQIGEGNLIELVREALPLVGEIQVADVPGRREPGTGEIAYPAIARALEGMGYDGVVGLEAWASGDPTDAIAAFRRAFASEGAPGGPGAPAAGM